MSPFEERCARRLANDVAALERFAAALPCRPDGSPRLRVAVARHGALVRAIRVRFAAVRTALRDRRSGAVVVRPLDVEAHIEPAPPYPFVPPQVRVFLPDLPEGHEPWLGALYWADVDGGLPELVARMLRALEGRRP